MNEIFHKNESRGLADHGWLISRHTFSFARYYNPERMNFGKLRVLNDDIVKPSMGFATHPHENMEIVSIPLSGSLQHEDSMGNKHLISAGEVQILSAGTGIAHSEYNYSDKEDVQFLQIWVLPKKMNVKPGYGQMNFDVSKRQNTFQLLVSPKKSDNTIWINQDAWFSITDIDAGNQVRYEKKDKVNGVYFFVLDGTVDIDGYVGEKRDGLGLVGTENHLVRAKTNVQMIAIEVSVAQD